MMIIIMLNTEKIISVMNLLKTNLPHAEVDGDAICPWLTVMGLNDKII